MRPGFNPSRRNRNIGTEKQGHGQNNQLCIADPRVATGWFWSQLTNYKVVRRECGGRELPFFVEETRQDCVHACSVADIVRVLNLISSQDYARLAAVILRQPKRKEEILQPVWGRMGYWADLVDPQVGLVAGRVVILEAVRRDGMRRIWRRLNPAEASELARLAADDHLVVTERGKVRVESTVKSSRNTQLYRTLPHEIGHLIDVGEGRHQEKEAFAHRYADEFRARSVASGHFPFPRIESWEEDGLRSCDFV
jgi:hypothetical protein